MDCLHFMLEIESCLKIPHISLAAQKGNASGV